MFSSLQEASGTDLETATALDRWHWESLSSAEEALSVVSFVAAAMAARGYSEKDVFETRLALEEAILNAIQHGNRGDPTKLVQVSYCVDADRVVIEVEDQGTGFDAEEVPDPRAPENLERPGGRGVLLMQLYMTWVRYNALGNCVTLCKRRAAP